MRDHYSLYEAKARLSALVRQVREGRRVVITVRGKPAVELRPIEAEGPDLPDRLAGLGERGVLVRRDPEARKVPPMVKRPGGLKRFLEERD